MIWVISHALEAVDFMDLMTLWLLSFAALVDVDVASLATNGMASVWSLLTELPLAEVSDFHSCLVGLKFKVGS